MLGPREAGKTSARRWVFKIKDKPTNQRTPEPRLYDLSKEPLQPTKQSTFVMESNLNSIGQNISLVFMTHTQIITNSNINFLNKLFSNKKKGDIIIVCVTFFDAISQETNRATLWGDEGELGYSKNALLRFNNIINKLFCKIGHEDLLIMPACLQKRGLEKLQKLNLLSKYDHAENPCPFIIGRAPSDKKFCIYGGRGIAYKLFEQLEGREEEWARNYREYLNFVHNEMPRNLKYFDESLGCLEANLLNELPSDLTKVVRSYFVAPEKL